MQRAQGLGAWPCGAVGLASALHRHTALYALTVERLVLRGREDCFGVSCGVVVGYHRRFADQAVPRVCAPSGWARRPGVNDTSHARPWRVLRSAPKGVLFTARHPPEYARGLGWRARTAFTILKEPIFSSTQLEGFSR